MQQFLLDIFKFKFQKKKKKFRRYPYDSRWQILKSSNIYFNFTSWHSIHTGTRNTGNFSLKMVSERYIYIYIRRIFRGSLEYRKERHFVIYTQYPVAALNHYEWISRSFGMSTCWTHARYVFSHDRLSFWTIAQDQVPLRIFPALGNICSVWWDRFTPISPVLCNIRHFVVLLDSKPIEKCGQNWCIIFRRTGRQDMIKKVGFEI